MPVQCQTSCVERGCVASIVERTHKACQIPAGNEEECGRVMGQEERSETGVSSGSGCTVARDTKRRCVCMRGCVLGFNRRCAGMGGHFAGPCCYSQAYKASGTTDKRLCRMPASSDPQESGTAVLP